MLTSYVAKRYWVISTVLFLAAALAFSSALWSCTGENPAKKTEAISIGVPPLTQNALIYVADHQEMFSRNGLEVTIKDYDTGVATIDAMLKGEVDIAEAAEFPFVSAVMRKKKLFIIACNDKFENVYIIGRKDHGIETIPDLKGKRIGIALQTIAEFRLGRFLSLNGMDIKDVTLSDVRPAQFQDAIAAGAVDAIIAWEPYVHQIVEKEGERVVVWPAQSSQAAYGILVCTGKWLKDHTSVIHRLLKSLAEAEDYLTAHPEEAKAIVGERLHYDDSHIASIWPKHYFALSLDQTLVTAMKDQARWMINSQLTSERELPDFVGYIYTDGLKAIRPEAVNIIR